MKRVIDERVIIRESEIHITRIVSTACGVVRSSLTHRPVKMAELLKICIIYFRLDFDFHGIKTSILRRCQ